MLNIYNTLSRQKEEFVPIHGNRVNMFVCGLSPYDYAHLGHAKTYINYDVMARYLTFKGYRVFYIQNVTDVEDRIIKRANETGRETKDLVKEFFEEYQNDMKELNVESVNRYEWATDYLPEIIEQIKILIDKGYAYEANGNVYYDVNKFEDFGALSNINVEDHTESLEHSAQLEEDESKRHPADFALWKAWKEGEPSWDSPWGKGRPGWHIEDTAIAITHFGPQYDIHGGATELMFPHHEAEIAQAEVITGKKPYVKYWPHTGVLNVDGKKMSKSLGNFMTVRDALKLCTPQTLRFFFVNVHYRSPFDFTKEQLVEAGKSYERLLETIRNAEEALQKELRPDPLAEKRLMEAIERTKQKFFESMDDDFNTREAMTSLFEFSRELNKFSIKGNVSRNTIDQALKLFSTTGQILGVFQEMRIKYFEIKDKAFAVDAILVRFKDFTIADYEEFIEDLLRILAEAREDTRKRKDFETSDKIRAKLRELGIVLEDTKDGIRWKRAW